MKMLRFPISAVRNDYIKLLMPEQAKPLSFTTDENGALCVWALCDVFKPPAHKKFYICQSGVKLPDEQFQWIKYVGSAVADGTVWHLWEC